MDNKKLTKELMKVINSEYKTYFTYEEMCKFKRCFKDFFNILQKVENQNARKERK
jgi:hypothetical protein